MALDRREFVSLAAGSTLIVPSIAKTAASLVFIGTYTGQTSKGIHVFRFDGGSGKMEPLGLAAETTNPSFLAIHRNGKYLYAAVEVGSFGGQKGGSVSAFSIDKASGKLTPLNAQSSKGPGPCYVSVDASGRNVLVANYSGGSIAVLPLAGDGTLKEASAFMQHKGSSVNPKRQREPHAHCIKVSPDGRLVLASDLGTDQVFVYRFDPAAGTLTANEPDSYKAKPGAGPRHFAFHPNGRVLYVINELDSTVAVLNWDAKKGAASEFQTVSTLPEGFPPEKNSTAEVVVHPNGKLLFGSNRGHNSIAVFGIDAKGKLTAKGHTPTQGEIPRNFALDPTGSFLIAANQRTNNLVVFRLDASGSLTPTGQVFEVGSPVCVRFLPLV